MSDLPQRAARKMSPAYMDNEQRYCENKGGWWQAGDEAGELMVMLCARMSCRWRSFQVQGN